MTRTLTVLSLLLAVGIAVFLLFPQTNTPTITVSDARASLSEADAPTTQISFTITNTGGPDRFVSARSALLGDLTLKSPQPNSAVVIPANSTPGFSSDGVSLTAQVAQPLQPGQLVPIEITFEQAGTIATRAEVQVLGGSVESEDPHANHGGMLHVMGDTPAPSVTMEVTQSADGMAIELSTENFLFTPTTPDITHVMGQGHAHLYLNGMRLQRMYGTTATIGTLPAGRYHIAVSLNTNDHRTYMSDAGWARAETFIDIK